MKKSRIVLVVLVAIFLGHAALMHATNNGHTRVLNAIREIRPGYDAKQVTDILGEKLNEFPAASAPSWIVESVGEKETGEYWHYLVLFPTRNIIIYFDEDGKVQFVTWSPT